VTLVNHFFAPNFLITLFSSSVIVAEQCNEGAAATTIVEVQDRVVQTVRRVRPLQVRGEVSVRPRPVRAPQTLPPPEVQDGAVQNVSHDGPLPVRTPLPLHSQPSGGGASSTAAEALQQLQLQHRRGEVLHLNTVSFILLRDIQVLIYHILYSLLVVKGENLFNTLYNKSIRPFQASD